MCDLDSAGTKGVTSPAGKDARQRDGDEPVNGEQTSWLRSLVGELRYLATDRLHVQYLVKNFTTDITRATCGTLARALREVQYFLRKPHPAWSFLAGSKLEDLDVHADSDWAATGEGTQGQLLCRDQARTVCARNEFHDARRLQWRSRVVHSNSARRMRYPTAAIPHRNRMPTFVACT